MITTRPTRGVNAPVITCDVCCHDITDGVGNVEWIANEHGLVLDRLYHTHKGCAGRLRSSIDLPPGALWLWEDLPLFLVYLAGNAGVDWIEAEGRALDLAEVGLARYTVRESPAEPRG